jgi:hypothetical protein
MATNREGPVPLPRGTMGDMLPHAGALVGRYPGWRSNPCDLPGGRGLQWHVRKSGGDEPRPLTVAGAAQAGAVPDGRGASASRLTVPT